MVSVCFILSASAASRRARAGSCRPRRHLLESPVARSKPDRPLGSTSRLLPHPLAMSLILGIDPDSPLQGGWSSRLKMAAAQVIDPGSNLHDHAAQHLDASARHPLRLAAERSHSTPPPGAPRLHPHGEPTRLHPHGEPTPCPSHTAAAAVAGHSHPSLVDGGRAASCRPPCAPGLHPHGGPPPAGCSWAAAGAQPSASDEAYENLYAILQEALDGFDHPPDALLPPPSMRSSGDSPSPPPERPSGEPLSPPLTPAASGCGWTLAALLLQAAWRGPPLF